MYWTLCVVVCLLAGTEAQKPVPSWLADELQYMRRDAEMQVRTAQSLLAKIDNSIIRTRGTGDVVPTVRSPQVGVTGYPKNCREALNRGYDYISQWHTIDPDGDGGVQPLRVRCQRKGNAYITKFGFASDYWTKKYQGPRNCVDRSEFGVPGLEDLCPDTKTEVNYVWSKQQMRSAIYVSGKCTQRVSWDCYSNSLLYLKGLSSRILAFGRSLNDFSYFTQGVCECANNDRCILTHTQCNCASDPTNSWQRDAIVVRDTGNLPVTQVQLGDLKRFSDRAQVYVFNVECED